MRCNALQALSPDLRVVQLGAFEYSVAAQHLGNPLQPPLPPLLGVVAAHQVESQHHQRTGELGQGVPGDQAQSDQRG